MLHNLTTNGTQANGYSDLTRSYISKYWDMQPSACRSSPMCGDCQSWDSHGETTPCLCLRHSAGVVGEAHQWK